jgi:hypothetical protein
MLVDNLDQEQMFGWSFQNAFISYVSNTEFVVAEIHIQN